MRRSLSLPLLALFALGPLAAACREEPSVPERFNAIAAEVENKAREYEAGAENLVREQEQRLSNEAEALFQQNANALGNAGETDVDVNSE